MPFSRNRAWCVPTACMRPRSSTIIRSALRTVARRCAITSVGHGDPRRAGASSRADQGSGRAGVRAKVALSRTSVRIAPRQFGPRIRTPWRLAASSIFWWRAPLPSTMAALMPTAPASSMISGTVREGVAMTARSTGPDKRLTPRTPMDGVYLCGAGTYPGGSVIGINGRNAAMEILTEKSIEP